MKQEHGLIFVISGPSGSGKTSLLGDLIKTPELKHRLARSVSFTTRPKRLGEKNGKDYFFIREEQFKQIRRKKKILEWTRYLGYYYATPKDFLGRQIKKGRHTVLCLDLKGTLKIKRLYSENTVTIFVMPPGLETLKNRIVKRCNRTKGEEIAKRLKLAKQELKACHHYDYCIVNRDFTQTVNKMKSIILNKIGLLKGHYTRRSDISYGLRIVRETFR